MKIQVNKSNEFETIIIFLHGTVKEIEKYLKRNKYLLDEKFEEDEVGACITCKNDTYIIWVKNDNKEYNVILHEVDHLINKMLDYRLLSYSSETSEVYAYYHGYWGEKAILFFRGK